MSGEGALRNIPHADGSRECHPLPAGVRRGVPLDPTAEDAAVAETFRAYVEAGRWLSEQQGELARKAQDVVAAAVGRERARVAYLDALCARDGSIAAADQTVAGAI